MSRPDALAAAIERLSRRQAKERLEKEVSERLTAGHARELNAWVDADGLLKFFERKP